MANRTARDATIVRGTDPQYLIDKIVRNKIYGCRFWKENCTGLTAESLVDEAIKLEYVGGTYGGNRAPTKFITLILKMLQLAPERDIILEYIKNPDYKYVTVLAMFYWRMVNTAVECHTVLEEYYQDYRKIRYRNEDGSFSLIHIDEFVDDLLNKEVYCSTVLPHIQTRINLEDFNNFPPRVSLLEKELEIELQREKQEQEEQERQNREANQLQEQKNKNNERERSKTPKKKKDKKDKKKKKKHSRSRSRSRSGHKKKHKKHKDWRKVVSGKYRNRSRSRSNENNNDDNNKKSGEPEKGSIEAENELRAKLGIPLLPTN